LHAYLILKGPVINVTKMRSFNFQAFLEFIICIGFSATLIYFIGSGKYLEYVAPRVEPYLWFAAVVLLVWAAVSTPWMFRPRHKKRASHCLVLLVPLALLLAPREALAASDVSYRQVRTTTSATRSGLYVLAGEKKTLPNVTRAPAQSEATPPEATPQAPESPDTIFIGSDDWYFQVSAIQDYPDAYIGRTVKLTGFIYRIPGESDVIIARLAMTCCVADVVVSGLPFEYAGAENLQNDDWFTLTGVIEQREDSGGTAYISVTAIEAAGAIPNYVYTS
jgi:putative membrane protein